MKPHIPAALMPIALIVLLFISGADVLAQNVQPAPAERTAATGVASTNLWKPTLRMAGGLAVVLALLGATAFAARRMRRGSAYQAGAIEIVSGMSLGGRDKVVLLRVHGDEVLVGVSPGGMRALHVLQHAEPVHFEKFMESTQTMRPAR